MTSSSLSTVLVLAGLGLCLLLISPALGQQIDPYHGYDCEEMERQCLHDMGYVFSDHQDTMNTDRLAQMCRISSCHKASLVCKSDNLDGLSYICHPETYYRLNVALKFCIEPNQAKIDHRYANCMQGIDPKDVCWAHFNRWCSAWGVSAYCPQTCRIQATYQYIVLFALLHNPQCPLNPHAQVCPRPKLNCSFLGAENTIVAAWKFGEAEWEKGKGKEYEEKKEEKKEKEEEEEEEEKKDEEKEDEEEEGEGGEGGIAVAATEAAKWKLTQNTKEAAWNNTIVAAWKFGEAEWEKGKRKEYEEKKEKKEEEEEEEEEVVVEEEVEEKEEE
ncbi:hypothetical protein ACOMHN_055071 [Nucella lapillus]